MSAIVHVLTKHEQLMFEGHTKADGKEVATGGVMVVIAADAVVAASHPVKEMLAE